MHAQMGMSGGMAASGAGVRQAIEAWLGQLEVGEEQPLGPLRVSPVVHQGPHEPPFLLLHEALAAKQLEIAEQGSGTVNEVVAHNLGDLPVLILEGESVVGAKQNRVVTEDVVLAPGTMSTVPVGCVERGRWRAVSFAFAAAPTPVEPMIRRHNVREVSTHGRLDQHRLWQDVDAKLAVAAADSVTGDYHCFSEGMLPGARQQGEAFRAVPHQVGLLACCEGVLVGLDLLGHPDNWASYGPRAVASYSLSGMWHDWRGFVAQAGSSTAPRPASEWLKGLTGARMLVRPARGLGLQLRIEGVGIEGGGLWVGARPAHLAAFARV